MQNSGPLGHKTGLIDNLEEVDWEKAKIYFETNPGETKFDKFDSEQKKAQKDEREKRANCSFIKVQEQIYAIKNGECVGEGNFGKVKIIQKKDGSNFAVKIESGDYQDDIQDEIRVMEVLGQFHGKAIRHNYNKLFKDEVAMTKQYTVMNLQEGHELTNELYSSVDPKKQKELTHEEKLQLAIKSAEAIKFLHDNRVIHADIKPQNLMAKVDGEVIMIAAIDFGFSMILEEGKQSIKGEAEGSPLYCAPEICELSYDSKGKLTGLKWKDLAEFSFASDIYALGAMFKYDFKLDLGEAFYQKILNASPSQRYSVQGLIEELNNALESHLKIKAEEKYVMDLVDPNAQYDLGSNDTLENLRNILNQTTKEMEEKYSHHRKKTGLGWLKNMTKGRKVRAEQLKTISDALTKLEGVKLLIDEQGYDPETKNQRIEESFEEFDSTLKKVQGQINKEFHFLGGSGLSALIDELREPIITQIEQLNQQPDATASKRNKLE